MTPWHMARRQCANFEPDGSCVGLYPEDQIELRRWNPDVPPGRCRYVGKVRISSAEIRGIRLIPYFLYAALIALTVFSVLFMALAIIRKLVNAASYPL